MYERKHGSKKQEICEEKRKTIKKDEIYLFLIKAKEKKKRAKTWELMSGNLIFNHHIKYILFIRSFL